MSRLLTFVLDSGQTYFSLSWIATKQDFWTQKSKPVVCFYVLTCPPHKLTLKLAEIHILRVECKCQIRTTIESSLSSFAASCDPWTKELSGGFNCQLPWAQRTIDPVNDNVLYKILFCLKSYHLEEKWTSYLKTNVISECSAFKQQPSLVVSSGVFCINVDRPHILEQKKTRQQTNKFGEMDIKRETRTERENQFVERDVHNTLSSDRKQKSNLKENLISTWGLLRFKCLFSVL